MMLKQCGGVIKDGICTKCYNRSSTTSTICRHLYEVVQEPKVEEQAEEQLKEKQEPFKITEFDLPPAAVSPEDVLERNGFDFSAFQADNEYSARNLLLAMVEFASLQCSQALAKKRSEVIEECLQVFNDHIPHGVKWQYVYEGIEAKIKSHAP